MTASLIVALVICMIIPPVVVAIFSKQTLQVLLNILLTAFFIIPGVAHAIFIIIDSKIRKKEEIAKEGIKGSEV